MSAGWTAAATLTGMAVYTEGEVTRIHVTLDGPVEVSHFTLRDPARLFVDCRGVDKVLPESLPVGEGRAGRIEASVWQGDGQFAMTRIAVDLTRPSVTEVTKVDDGLVITLSPEAQGEWTHGEPAGEDPLENLTTADAAPEDLMGTETATSPSEVNPEEEVLPENTGPEEQEALSEYKLPETPDPSDYYIRTEPTVKSFQIYEESGLSGRGGPRVSLDIQEADIYTVLRSISEYSGVNIVMGYSVAEEVNEPVSYHLENVPWGEALETVLRSAKLWYREENGIIRVDTEENLRQEEIKRGTAARQMEEILPLTTRIVEVVYATAGELKPSVEKTLSRRGVIETDPRTNSLVVTDIAARVEAAVEMIQHLDSQTPQVEIVAKLIDVDARYSRDLGVLWTVTGTHSSEGASGEVVAGSNTVVDPGGAIRFGLVRSWGEVNAILSALENQNRANIISNPRITTVNNRQARILVGKKIPLITLDEAGNAVTELTTIGISLLVTPHINDNNRITLDLHPEVSDLSSQATVQGGIIINTSEADTRVMLENGETAVIGGLIRLNDGETERGVPVLMHIPIVGDLFFKGSSKIQEKRELIIFVTPRIVSSYAANEDEVSDYSDN